MATIRVGRDTQLRNHGVQYLPILFHHCDMSPNSYTVWLHKSIMSLATWKQIMFTELILNLSMTSYRVITVFTMLQAWGSRVRVLTMRWSDFSIDLILPAALGPWVQLSLVIEMTTRILPGGKGWPGHKADNLTAICELIVYKIWDPRHFTTLWACTASYRNSFTLF
jgi:hypothetical protein